jgi:ABC-type polysaccharide/polyol phosphate transport system ATPase subunit
MQENVKPEESEAIGAACPEPAIRFFDVGKTFRYHGARLSDEDEEGIAEEDDSKPEGLKPGETRTALENINLVILPGERVGIIGANGAGKTTLLNIVAGMSHPTSGRVVGRGSIVPLNHVTRPLNEKWSGLRNLRALARFLGFPAKIIDERAAKIARFAAMEDAILQPVATYSRNMYARLAFAAALELDGDIYISDDMLGVGDQAFQAKCFQRLVKLCEAGKTLLFATHKLKLVEQLCTRAVWLDKGQVRADNQPNTVVAEYRASPVADADVEGGADGQANVASAWFKQKYGVAYPLPRASIEPTYAIPDPERGELPDFPIENPALGGIVALELTAKSELEGIVAENAAFSVLARVNVLAQDTTVDLMFEIFRGKALVYQSLPAEPIFVQTPRGLVFEIGVDSSLLPDHLYRMRLSTVFAPAGEDRRFISRGQIFVATNNCGLKLHPRAKSFAWGAPPAAPLNMLELDWRLLKSDEQPVSNQSEGAPPVRQAS